MSLSLANEVTDDDWGCTYQAITNSAGKPNIKICFVKVQELNNFASRITELVLDTSWMTALDKGTKRAYETTVAETAGVLVEIFKKTVADGTIGAEFGEVMVSIGSARALKEIFDHVSIPIAELWKPQVKQNEGFDFHTVCTDKYINFGEAKFSGSGTPHGLAITQAGNFISAKKHLRDRIHLEKLVKQPSLDYLDNDSFGVVAAFSLNAQQPLTVFKNAMDSAIKMADAKKVTNFYLVGVRNEC